MKCKECGEEFTPDGEDFGYCRIHNRCISAWTKAYGKDIWDNNQEHRILVYQSELAAIDEKIALRIDELSILMHRKRSTQELLHNEKA